MTAGVPTDIVVYERAGDGGSATEPLIVLVHGAMDRAASMIKVQKRLRDRTVVRYDRRGYGRSASASVGGLEVHADDLLSIIGDRRAVVIGHSFGGLVALAAAATGAPQVAAVGAFESPMAWAPWWPIERRIPVDADPAEVAEGFMRRVVGRPAWEALPERIRQARRAEGPALIADLGRLLPGASPFDLTAVPVPVVSGYGTASAEHLRRASCDLVDLVPDGRALAIDGAGHGAHLSHPDEFTELVHLVLDLAA